MSASGESARNGARSRSAASIGPTWTSIANTTGCPCSSAGTNGTGGAGSTFAIVESSSGAAPAAAANPAIVSAVRRQDEHAADHRVDRMQPQVEPRRDAEVAAAAADRPEEVGLVLRVDLPHAAVRRDELGADEAVDREAVPANEVAHAAAERQPTDAHRACVAEGHGEPVCAGGVHDLPRREPGLRAGDPVARVELEPPHAREVEHDPTLADAVPGAGVAAAADGELEAALAGERDHEGDLELVDRADDHRRPAVDPR